MLPLTATEVFVEFKPPMETFGEIVPGTSVHLRMRISPDIAIGMGVRVKTPGERKTGRDHSPEALRQGIHSGGQCFMRRDYHPQRQRLPRLPPQGGRPGRETGLAEDAAWHC